MARHTTAPHARSTAASKARALRYLFVYGTLRPGHAPARIAAEVRRLHEVGRASVRGRAYDLGQYPGAVLDATAGTTIEGMLLRLPDDPSVLAALDAYEGFDPKARERSLFVRTRASAMLSDGRRLACWVYVYNGERARRPSPRSQPPRQSTK